MLSRDVDDEEREQYRVEEGERGAAGELLPERADLLERQRSDPSDFACALPVHIVSQRRHQDGHRDAARAKDAPWHKSPVTEKQHDCVRCENQDGEQVRIHHGRTGDDVCRAAQP